jgi:hypothetical protein
MGQGAADDTQEGGDDEKSKVGNSMNARGVGSPVPRALGNLLWQEFDDQPKRSRNSIPCGQFVCDCLMTEWQRCRAGIWIEL